MFEFAPALLNQLNRSVRSRLAAPRPSLTISIPPRKKAPAFLGFEHLAAKPAKVDHALTQAIVHLKSLQNSKGYWEGRIYDNVTITAEYVMFLQFMGFLPKSVSDRAKKTILQTQTPDGGWSIYLGGPSDHSATVEAYFALKLCGLERQHEAMCRAYKLIQERGGIETTRVFTKISLAIFGQYPWSRVPVINPELMLLPQQAPIHIYEFSSWSRCVIIPLLIIFDRKPVVKLPPQKCVNELYMDLAPPSASDRLKTLLKKRKVDLEEIFRVAQRVLFFYEKSPLKPLRKRALDLAEEWILIHQDPNGNWGGIFPAMAYSLMALHLRGYPFNHPVMEKGLAMLRSFAEKTKSTFRMQSTTSPIWDTAISMVAFEIAGVDLKDPSLEKAANWLLKKQILDVYGDWQIKAGSGIRPGGWPFEHENDRYPDIDDSALALLALLPLEHILEDSQPITHAIDRGLEWLLGMQGSDGGWGAFDRDNNQQILNQIPFADLKSLLDPSTPDVTGHVLEALGKADFELSSKPVLRAIRFLKKNQEKNGSWFGRWGINYVYGTAAVLSGLKAVGEDMGQKYIQRARDFLLGVQKEDGGFGESPVSYDLGGYVPWSHSTASQTAWALIGLLCCKDTPQTVLDKAMGWLVENQQADGSWNEPEWTGTGFPKHFYLRYDYYRLYFPIYALGLYRKGGLDNPKRKHGHPEA